MQQQISMQVNLDDVILITGGTGLVGKALLIELKEQGYSNVIALGSKDCDLRNLSSVKSLMQRIKPDFVFHLAARVHGLGGNTKYKSDILVDNVLINTNVIEESRVVGVKKIVAMGSGCVYPELKGEEELFEEQMWLGPPHASEDSYAHAKRLMCAQLDAAREQYGLSSSFVISGNLYGPHDNFNSEDGHVIPSLIAKFHRSRENGLPVNVWGSGVAIRDFTHASDMAKALILILKDIEGKVNAGSGNRHAIKEIVEVLHEYTAVPVEWDQSKPNGQLIRYYNLSKLFSTNFEASIGLREGIINTYKWYVDNFSSARKEY